MDIFQIVQDCDYECKENVDKKFASVSPSIEDESVTCGEMDDVKNCDELYKIDPMLCGRNIDFIFKGDSSGMWQCYANDCKQIYNSVILDSRCKSCKKGINPYYYFISNENDQVGKYPILLKKFGLVEGKMDVSDCYVNANFAA